MSKATENPPSKKQDNDDGDDDSDYNPPKDEKVDEEEEEEDTDEDDIQVDVQPLRKKAKKGQPALTTATATAHNTTTTSAVESETTEKPRRCRRTANQIAIDDAEKHNPGLLQAFKEYVISNPLYHKDFIHWRDEDYCPPPPKLKQKDINRWMRALREVSTYFKTLEH